MASYTELLNIAIGPAGQDLRTRLRVAVVVAADVVRAETSGTNLANRKAWARNVLNDPDREADRMMWAVLAQNRALTAAQITGATDENVQTAVNAAIDLLAGVA